LGPVKFIQYSEDLADLIRSYGYQFGYHLYSDDNRLIALTANATVGLTMDRLQQCVADILVIHGARRDDST